MVKQLDQVCCIILTVISEIPPNTELVGELLEALHPMLEKMRDERTLSPGKVGILHYLSRHGKATGAQLAATIRVSPQAISLSTPELEELGFIQRVRDEEDRRRTWIVLTDAGRTRLHQEIRTGERWLGRAIGERLSAQERNTLKDVIPLLKKLSAEEPCG